MRAGLPEHGARSADRLGAAVVDEGVPAAEVLGASRPRAGQRRRTSRRRFVPGSGWARSSRFAWLRSSDALLVAAVLSLGAGLLAYLPYAFGLDTWLGLAAGREIWQTGIPHHETLTVIAHGAGWVDQQWLAQLVSYAVYRVGGLGLLGAVNVALMVAGIAVAVRAARKLGASSRTVLLALPLCVWMIIPAREVRTQAFVIPLFVVAVYLLATDSRRSSSRVYWCLPILVLWANLHGTVSIGAGLVVLRGLTMAWERRGLVTAAPRQILRPLILVLGAPLCLLVTPYGLKTLSYYHDTLLNSALKHAVSEWQPITSSPLVAVPFFLLAGIMLWSFGRHPGRTTLWDRLALIALAAVSISVVRNVALFALCAIVIVPVSLQRGRRGEEGRQAPARPRVNAALVFVALAWVLIALIATLGRPEAKFESVTQRPGMLQAVRSVTQSDPGLKVFADVRFSDWLLWRDPALRGRVASDARYELYSGAQIKRLLRTFEALGPNWKLAARGYRLLILDRTADRDSVAGFLSEPGRRVLYEDADRIVILRPSTLPQRLRPEPG